MRQITLLVIHCSASPNGDSLFRGTPGQPGFQTPASAIDSWHAKRGFKRVPEARTRFNTDLAAIGYHHLIYHNGAVVCGRAHEEIGAHVSGYNQKSLGVCMVGTDAFSARQWASLRDLVSMLRRQYPEARVVGHRDLSPDTNENGVVEKFEWLKTCPGFDVAAWLDGGMAPIKAQELPDAHS